MRRLFKKITFGVFDHPNSTTDDDDQTPQEPTGLILGGDADLLLEERLSDDRTAGESRSPPPRTTRRAAAAERFPQFLTTMDAAGRPRYVMEKVRSEGRLVIFMAESRERRRRVVRTAPSADINEATTTRLVIPKD